MINTVALELDTYTSRTPRKNRYYRLVEDNFEQLEKVWEQKYRQKYGYWRPYVTDVIYKFLDCGDPHMGFARVKCDDCKHEYILPFSCKRRHFCPSCHQKRVIEFGEHLHEEVLEDVPHRQWVFSIPKRLRPYFMYDRKLLAKLSRCAWNVLSEYLKASITVNDPIPGLVAGRTCCSPMQPGCVIAVQTFGEFINFNPHLHIIATDGCFCTDGSFMIGVIPNAADLEATFAVEVFDMLKKEGKINRIIIDNMNSWEHSGFNVYCGQPVKTMDDDGIERLAQYIVRAPISQERMVYTSAKESPDGTGKVVYDGKTSRIDETFTAVDWLARLITHIPNKGEQMVRYYGHYSNKSRGIRKKEELTNTTENQSPCSANTAISIVKTDLARKKFRKNWARLIQKVYFVDPLLCPKCGGSMKIISFIEDDTTIKKILTHLDLWLPQTHDPPQKESSCNTSHKQHHRSFEWWETINHLSVNEYSDDNIVQRPFEDEYSQLNPCTWEC